MRVGLEIKDGIIGGSKEDATSMLEEILEYPEAEAEAEESVLNSNPFSFPSFHGVRVSSTTLSLKLLGKSH